MTNLFDTIYTLWLREMKRFILSRSRIAGSIGQPFIWLAIIGVGLSSAFTLAKGGSYLTFMSAGIIGMTILFTSIFAGISVIWDKQFGFLKEILVAPVSRWGIVLGKIAGSTTISMATALIVLVVVIAFGIIPLSSLTVLGVILALIFMVLISTTFVSFGLVIAAKLNNIEGFQVIMNFLIMPLFFLSGALFPLSTAPVWLRGISFIDPLSYAVDGIRGSLGGVSTYPLTLDMAVIVAVAAAFLFIGYLAFKKIQGK